MLRGLLLVLIAACATTAAPRPASGPRGLRASEHLDAARDHDEEARRKAMWPDIRSVSPTSPPAGVWYHSWETPAEHARLAEVHRSQASQIHAEFTDLCKQFSREEIAVSPLQRFGVGGWNTSVGVIVYLSASAGPSERLMLHLRCHRAWMMLGPSDMEACPLDLPGLALDARGDAAGITVSIVAKDKQSVAELQRRTAKDLEAARVRAARF